MINIISRIHIWLKYNVFKKGNTKESIKLQKDFIKKYNLKNYEDVQKFVGQKMKYKYDPLRGQIDTLCDLDKIQESNFEGDCDEYSMLQHRLLTELGYESYIVSYVQKNIVNSHSMCLFKLENGKFQSISTEGLKKEFNSVDEWLKSYDDWLGGYIKVIFLYGKDLKYIEKEKI